MNTHQIQHIIVTKPTTTATPLIQQLQQLGVTPLSFPTLEIVARPEVTLHFQQFHDTTFDSAIFISPTAVQYAVTLCQLKPHHWPHTHIIAQGQGTANALKQYGFVNIFFPKNDYSSEGLLALPILKDCAHHKIALFKGVGGRGLLSPYLQEKGAIVSEFNCYERRCPAPALDLSTDVKSPEQSLFIVTSSTGLRNLATLLHFDRPMNNLNWQNCHLLVINDKMAQLARNLGHKGKIDLANNASDAALILRIKQLMVNS